MARLDNIGAAGATGTRTSAGTRALMVAAIVMAVLIVLGTTVLVVVVARRLGGAAETRAGAPIALQLGEPDGTRIAGVAAAGDRLAVQLQGGGPDRIVLVDPRSGAVVGRIRLH